MADLHGSHYDVGYLYVQLLANETAAVRGDIAHRNCASDGIAATVTRCRCRAWAVQTYAAFMQSQVGNSTLIQEVLELFLDWQYSKFLVNGLQFDSQVEMVGIMDAAYHLNIPQIASYIQRTLVRADGAAA